MKLKLGRLPSKIKIRLTVVMPDLLKHQLDRYANLHSRTWGQNLTTEELIAAILRQFLESDTTFQKEERLLAEADELRNSRSEKLPPGAQ